MNRAVQSCGNCNAWTAAEERPAQPGMVLQGFCRAHPATPFRIIMPPKVPNHQPSEGVQGYYPPASASGWCREWEPVSRNHFTGEDE